MGLAHEVEPRSTAALILGASTWPRAPRLEAAPSFAQSARDVAAYLTDAGGFALPRENLLDLFDLDAEAIELQDRITEFLLAARARMEAAGGKLRDIVVFYVGHGAYDEGSEFYLAIRRTRADNELASSLSAEHLARVLRAGGRRARRYVILDCCFAGGAVDEFILQSGIAQTMVQKLRREFPIEGTALLCSSSRQDPSKAPRGATYTMFSGALLEVLRGGDPDQPGAFSIEALAETMTERIRRKYEDAGTRPEVHCPDQRTGVVSKVPLFRNPGWTHLEQDRQDRLRREAEERREEDERRRDEEQRRQEEEQRRQEEERRRKEEEEKQGRKGGGIGTPPRARRGLRIVAAVLVAALLGSVLLAQAAKEQQDIAMMLLALIALVPALVLCGGFALVGGLLLYFGRPAAAAGETGAELINVGWFSVARADLQWAVLLAGGGFGAAIVLGQGL